MRPPKAPLASIVLAAAVIAMSANDSAAQSFRDRLRQALDDDPPEVPDVQSAIEDRAAEPTNLDDDSAASLAAENCVKAGEVDTAADIAMLFGGNGQQGLVSSDISNYLVGLCIPESFADQSSLNQYLLSKGAAYSFYSERSLEELAQYLEAGGVELGIRFEALQRDDTLMATLSAENGIDKAAFMLNQSHELGANVAEFVPAISRLQVEQRTDALALAGRARSHATNAAYYLSRGVYVSQQMSSTMIQDVQDQAVDLRDQVVGFGNRLRILQEDSDNALEFIDEAGEATRNQNIETGTATAAFSAFVVTNGQALVGSLTNAVGIVKSFDTEVAEIPRLSAEELDADVQRLNEVWDLPAEFADEDAYSSANTFIE